MLFLYPKNLGSYICCWINNYISIIASSNNNILFWNYECSLPHLPFVFFFFILRSTSWEMYKQHTVHKSRGSLFFVFCASQLDPQLASFASICVKMLGIALFYFPLWFKLFNYEAYKYFIRFCNQRTRCIQQVQLLSLHPPPWTAVFISLCFILSPFIF